MTLIHLTNDSAVNFAGWLRTNIDFVPPHQRGYFGSECSYELGKQTGLDTHHLDLFVGIEPGQSKTYDLSQFLPGDYVPLAGWDPKAKQLWSGIPVTVAGVALEQIGDPVANGAAFDGHWRGKVGGLLINLWVTWYPHSPGIAYGEISICASSPGTPDVRATIEPNMRLVFGDAIVLVPGLVTDSEYAHPSLMAMGDWLADGQSRILPLVLCWERHGGNLEMCRALADQKIQARGLQRLHADGNPHVPEGFDAAKWARDIMPEVMQRQHDWFNQPFPLDPAEVSSRGGAQGSQAFVAGAAMQHALAVGPFYLAALDGSWPMFHCEPSGEPLDWKSHPQLRMFYGRVNRRLNLDDTLGKPYEPTSADSHGYQGPEDEHWFDWVLWAGARLKGTPALQWHMRAHAVHFLFRYVTIEPGTNLTANRGVGWLNFLAVELWRNLEDRELAEAIKQRWLDLWPKIQAQFAGDLFWDWRRDDRLGPGIRAMPWQAAVFALGLSWAGTAFDRWDVVERAGEIGHEILTRAYEQGSDGRWRSHPIITQDGSYAGPYEQYGMYLGYYDYFGMPMAPAAVLRHNPGHALAQEIWRQLLNDQPDYAAASWLAPGVQVGQ